MTDQQLPPPVTHAQWSRDRGWVTVTNLEPRQLTPVWRFDLDEQRRLRLANGGDR